MATGNRIKHTANSGRGPQHIRSTNRVARTPKSVLAMFQRSTQLLLQCISLWTDIRTSVFQISGYPDFTEKFHYLRILLGILAEI